MRSILSEFKRKPTGQESCKFWQQPGGKTWKKGEEKTRPFASSPVVKVQSFRERVREQPPRETRELCFSECGPEKGQAPAPSGYDRAGTLTSSRRLWLPT